MSSWHIYLQMRWFRSSTIPSPILIAYIWFTHLFAQILMTENLHICITHHIIYNICICFAFYYYKYIHVFHANIYVYYIQLCVSYYIQLCISYCVSICISYCVSICLYHPHFIYKYISIYITHCFHKYICMCYPLHPIKSISDTDLFFYVETHKVSTSRKKDQYWK